MSDVAAHTELVRTSRAFHKNKIAPPASVAAFRRYLSRTRRTDYDACFVILRVSGTLVGVFNVSQIFRGNFKSAYLGYYAGARHAGQGLMLEALELVLRRVFGKLRLHRIEANIQPWNRASRALVRRAGFRLEGLSRRYLKISGRWRDHERWALTAEDWQAKRRRNPGK